MWHPVGFCGLRALAECGVVWRGVLWCGVCVCLCVCVCVCLFCLSVCGIRLGLAYVRIMAWFVLAGFWPLRWLTFCSIVLIEGCKRLSLTERSVAHVA